MKKTFVILNIMLLSMSLCVLKAEDKYSCFLSKDSVDLDMGQLRASMYLNECAYSLTKIKESGNKIVVLEEQDKLINDYRWEYVTSYSSVMEFRERLQESLNTMLINEIDRERFNKEFSRKNNDAARNSLMSAISGVQISVNPLSLITNVLITSARAYMDYGRRKDELSVELGDKYWELEKSHMNEITSLRSQLFNVIQETFGDYKISDDMYLRENNFEKLFSIISSREAELKVEALEDNKEIFQSFPPYWYELGCSYIDLYKDTNKTSYLSHAWAAFDRYKEMNDACPMLIEDERSGMISLYKLQYWPDLSDDDIRLLIKDVEKNVSGEANALLYAATQFALKLDMPNESLDMIRRCLVDYPSLSCKDEFVLAAASIWESVTSIKSKSLFITAVTKEISGLTLDTYLLLIKTLMHDEDINVYPLTILR